ncbi:MAG: Cna B-type domain-containing protein, partial [Gordonibacter sp.]
MHRCIAVCAAVVLALSPMNMVAFAGDSESGGTEEAGVPQGEKGTEGTLDTEGALDAGKDTAVPDSEEEGASTDDVIDEPSGKDVFGSIDADNVLLAGIAPALPLLASKAETRQIPPRAAYITKTAALVEGITPSDPNAATGGTVLDEERGTAAAMVSTGLSQIVEYHIVVNNAGPYQRSGVLDVTDAVPTGTTYIPGSAQFKFRSTANPANAVPGSLASCVTGQPGGGSAQVSWKLEKLSDGEEAYLTFRVSAPATAFDAGQTGMWDEKAFSNTAQMVDVDKRLTKTSETTYHQVQEARLTVVKQWDDNNDREGLRPQSVSMQLQADGVAYGDPVTLDAGNNWKHTWMALPVKDPATTAFVLYTVTETPTVPHYEAPVYTSNPQDESIVTVTNTRIPGTPTLVKTSDPAGGTNPGNAATVGVGQEITYTLTFDSMQGSATGIAVKDSIPAGLGFVPGSITFKPAGSSVAQPISDSAYNAATGEIVWPTYDQAALGTATFQFKAKVQPLDEGTASLLYSNSASAAFGGQPAVASNAVTHQQFNRWADITKTASLVEGVAASDPDAATGGTVLAEERGSADAMVSAGLSQIVEYHMVVKNTGAGQTSGKIDVTDAVPAGTAYIPGSAAYTFRSSANPAAPLPGSTA